MSSLSRLPKVEILCPFDESFLRIVRYECSCGMPQPISRLYFCRHCLDIRCGSCVSHEVDSHFCPGCSQTMPSAEARLKKHRCANCLDCPTCGHTLSTRAMSLQSQAAEDPTKVSLKKVYYLACGFCRWTTRDLGIPDQLVASGGWPEPENPALARFGILQDYYRTMAQREKMEKDTRKYMSRKISYKHLNEKFGLSSAAVRKRVGLPPLRSSGPMSLGSFCEDGSNEMAASVPVDIDEVENSPWDEIFEKSTDLTEVAGLEQRLWQIDLQKGVYPRHKQLMVKRSHRCRQCEHNLSKPEFNPSSIKFKIQLAAFYHIPEIKVLKMPPADSLKPGSKLDFILKVTNPTQHSTFIRILELESALKQRSEGTVTDTKKEGVSPDDSTDNENGSSVVAVSQARQPILVKATPRHKLSPNAKFIVPVVKGSLGSKIILPERDDAAEFDDTSSNAELAGIEDDKAIVAWRKGNKVALALSAMIPDDFQDSGDILTGFGLEFVYTNTVPALEHREFQKVEVVVPVYVILGKISN